MTPVAATGMGTWGILAQMRRKLSLPGLYRLVLKGLMGSGVLRRVFKLGTSSYVGVLLGYTAPPGPRLGHHSIKKTHFPIFQM